MMGNLELSSDLIDEGSEFHLTPRNQWTLVYTMIEW